MGKLSSGDRIPASPKPMLFGIVIGDLAAEYAKHDHFRWTVSVFSSSLKQVIIQSITDWPEEMPLFPLLTAEHVAMRLDPNQCSARLHQDLRRVAVDKTVTILSSGTAAITSCWDCFEKGVTVILASASISLTLQYLVSNVLRKLLLGRRPLFWTHWLNIQVQRYNHRHLDTTSFSRSEFCHSGIIKTLNRIVGEKRHWGTATRKRDMLRRLCSYWALLMLD